MNDIEVVIPVVGVNTNSSVITIGEIPGLEHVTPAMQELREAVGNHSSEFTVSM